MKKIYLSLIIVLFASLLYAEKISFSASSMTGQTGNANAVTRLVGAAFVQTQSMEIAAELIEMSGENYRYIKAEGNITGKNLETNMEFTCDSLEYDRVTKIAVLKGDVSLKDAENDVKAEAQIIEYNQETEVAVLQIQVKLIQKDNTCNGAYAVYQKKNQMLEISGNAQVRQKDDVFRAQQISLNMKTQEISLTGNVKGSVTQEATNDSR
ncbi:MAG: organic solvent tolerance protein OstA [Treponema sp.]|nr:organic solvent tolerance protein OstA [Treponema sp.]